MLCNVSSAKVAAGYELVKDLGHGLFSLPPLESCSDGERDLAAGDKWAYECRWAEDAVLDWQTKYAELNDWISANVPDAIFVIEWECEPRDCSDEPWADEDYTIPYVLKIPNGKDAVHFKLRWIGC